MIKSEAEIYRVLENLLRAAGDKPQTCVDLFAASEVRNLVESPNRVSDYLGHMWRRGLVQRWYAPKDTAQRSRYAYTWMAEVEQEPVPIPNNVSLLTTVQAKKPNVTITEGDAEIVLDFKEFTITVRRK